MDAQSLTLNLGGKWHRSYGSAPCPVCQPERRKNQSALTLSDGRDGRLLAHCKKLGCAFTDILSAAGVTACAYQPPHPAELARRAAEQAAIAQKKAAQAQAIWDEAQPITGTIAEAYLRHRGITADLPESLRFHPDCWHPTAKRFPAMVARVDGGETFAVHRTYLRGDSTGKADVEPAKAMLGNVSGGAVRLGDGVSCLVIAEGIETALALASGLVGWPATVWAALSTSGMVAVELPRQAGCLTIATDGDPAGAEAGRKLANRAWAAGWQVSMLPAPKGKDWADILAAAPPASPKQTTVNGRAGHDT